MALLGIRLWAVILMAVALTGCMNSEASRQGSFSAQNVSADSSDASSDASVEDEGIQHFIEFRARYALTYGHSFVVFGRMDSEGRVLEQEVAGLAPKSDNPNVYMAAHLVPVASSIGATDGDLEKEYMSAFWRVKLSEPEYRNLVTKIRKLQASRPVWHAVIYNCNSFVGDVAGFLGYQAPLHLLTPRNYIHRLRKMNGGTIGWTAPSPMTAKVSSNDR